jgi:hypothetical protein
MPTARHVLNDIAGHHRMQLLTQIIRLLLVMIPGQRAARLQEVEAEYHVTIAPQDDATLPELATLLDAIPPP